jgi:D-amino-acid oxidase
VTVRVIVVGAGVIGLSCAIRLREAGHDAAVIARDLPAETTSAVAAALWYPYRAMPQDLVTRWAAASYAELARLAAAEPGSGVRMRWGTELLLASAAEPWWRAAVPTLEPATDVPEGYAAGWRLQVPVADTSVYLPWLVQRLEALGGTVTRSWLSALPGQGVVVNCTGLAARALTDDETVVPVRGQVVHLEPTGRTEWLLVHSDAAALTYIVPREHDIVVGGTDVEGEWSRTPSPDTAEAILQRAALLVPELRHAEVLQHKVGLRPARPTVRLEKVGRTIHCYGHGGAGVTLSWGCADEVSELVGSP